MTAEIDTSPEALLAKIESFYRPVFVAATGQTDFTITREQGAEILRIVADLVRERDEARGECGRLENEYIGQKERAEKAEADAAALKAAWLNYIDLWNVNHTLGCPMDDTCGCPWVQQINAALSATAGTELLARMERMRKALTSLVDCVERIPFRDSTGLRLTATPMFEKAKAALADQPGEKA